MPNRILRDWTDSLRFDGISSDAERLFTRLLMKSDDYGRYHAETRLVKAGCFPLENQIRPNDLDRWLDELSHRQLILRYEVQGRTYLAIPNFGQRLRQSRHKFPPPAGEPDDWLPTSGDLAATSRDFPPDSETETETETETVRGEAATVLPFGSDAFVEAWEDFRKHRSEIRKPLKPTSTKLALKELEAMGEQRAIAALRHTVTKGWQGIREPTTNDNGQRTSKYTDAF